MHSTLVLSTWEARTVGWFVAECPQPPGRIVYRTESSQFAIPLKVVFKPFASPLYVRKIA